MLNAKDLKSAVTAMEFGDGYLDIYHSSEHLDYIMWKRGILLQVPNVTAAVTEKKDPRELKSGATRSGYRLQTTFHRYFYKIGTQSFKQRTKNLMTPVGLAVWWQDDGVLCQSDGFKYANLSTQGYSLEENACIIRTWNDHFGWSPKLKFYQQKNYDRETVNTHHRLALTKAQIVELSRVIAPFVHESFRYKLLIPT
jgi:hypothetical protein